MEIVKTETGMRFFHNNQLKMSLTLVRLRHTSTIKIVGNLFAAMIPEVCAFFTAEFELKHHIELDLSKAYYLCPDAVYALKRTTMEANERNLHFHIQKVSEPAYACIHSIRFVSQVLSGELTKTHLSPEALSSFQEELAFPVPVSMPAEETSDSVMPAGEGEITENPVFVSEQQETAKNDSVSTAAASSKSVLAHLPATRKLDNQSINPLERTKILPALKVPILLRLSTGQLYVGQKFKTTIGRAEFCDIVLSDSEYISHIHIHVVCDQNGQHIIVDENTTNTTKVNNHEILSGTYVDFDESAWLQLADEDFYIAVGKKSTDLLAEDPGFFSYLFCRQTNEYIPLSNETFLLGRESSWDGESMWEDTISRRHAYITSSSNKHYLTDNHSSNQTYLNNVPLEAEVPALLRNGDHFRLGLREFSYHHLAIKKEG